MSTMRICPKCLSAIPADAPEGTCPKCLLHAGFETQSDLNAPPGDAATPPSPGELAKHFPQLEILELLGAGGMGVVYKARQITLDRIVALKILPQSSRDPSFAERFTREARALAKLSHPNIVGIYDFGQADRLYYFLMEFIDGVNLRQMIRGERLSPREALTIVPQVCDALQYAHDQGIVHRDIKPENLLVDRKGRVHIADFGLAKLVGGSVDARLTQSQHIMGTPHYMAPEQFEKPLSVDHRADIYSLGVVLYEMLTGELPLGRFAPPSAKVQVDVRLDEVVLKTLEKEPERRYQQASEMKSEVETLGGVPMANLPPGMRDMFGSEYKSKTHIGKWPLVHLAFGLDPKTGQQRSARGIIAIGNKATGVLAMGGVAKGVIAFGGMAVGVFALGGLALGLFTFAGLGVGLLFCYGGLAIGTTAYGGLALGYGAFGGLAVGYYAMGAAAYGAHVVTDRIKDPEAREFFRGWGLILKPGFIAIAMSLIVGCQLLAIGARLWMRRRVQALRGTPVSATSRDAANAKPRFSRKAILGALWSPLFFIVVPLFLVVVPVVHGVDNPPAAPQPLVRTLLWLLGLVGMAAPIGSTAFGLAAISEIRHSAGKIIGLPLAVADALLYPILLLDALIMGCCAMLAGVVLTFVGRALGASHAGLGTIELLLLGALGLIIALPLDYWIVRKAWRAANKPLSGESSAPPR